MALPPAIPDLRTVSRTSSDESSADIVRRVRPFSYVSTTVTTTRFQSRQKLTGFTLTSTTPIR